MEQELWLRLLLAPKIGPVRAQTLISHYGTISSLFDIVDGRETEKDEAEALHLDIIEVLRSSSTKKRVKDIIVWCEKHQVEIVTLDDTRYPQLLKETNAAPMLLFALGDVGLLQSKCIAFVGKRDPDTYGKESGQKLVGECVALGYTIVSGLAYGIDSLSHQVTLNRKGKTIAVMATGIDTIYPATNRELAKEIQKEGLIITEHPPGVRGEPYRFIQRNRIISGLCRATVVVQAGKKSGSLATARFCLEQGRDLFATPGPIINGNNSGNNHLLLQGAAPALSGKEIAEYIEGASTVNELEVSTTNIVQPQQERLKLLPKLSTEEQALLDVLPIQGSMSIDDICEKLTLPLPAISSTLFTLEMLGVVEMSAGNCYKRSI